MSQPQQEDESTVIDGQALIDRLVAAEILREDTGTDDLRLTESFRRAWWDRIEPLRDEAKAMSELAALLDVDETDLRLADEDTFVLSYQGSQVGEWPSRAAFLGDISLQPTIDEWLPLWERVDPISQGTLLSRLRGFLERCPSCDGHIEVSEEPQAESPRRAVSFACIDCGEIMTTGEFE